MEKFIKRTVIVATLLRIAKATIACTIFAAVRQNIAAIAIAKDRKTVPPVRLIAEIAKPMAVLALGMCNARLNIVCMVIAVRKKFFAATITATLEKFI